ncbi:hypothetical protein FPCIR_12712 [Fusarium pseudocircinatum]|uniref:Uncharacterized protein n=1 Tax=Fusarium pseudocircinatum TaxID=56676 RepID=A0A8H5KL11_9HYPO|nr:hypothetical protein FPCIR_12712 [Fusarium pseudocircinatum]
MDATKTSDDGDEEIQICIEDPGLSPRYPRYVPDDPLENARRAAYFEMLKKEAGEGSLVDMIAPRQTPKEWLQSLTLVDFAAPSAVISLRLDLATNKVAHFDLVTDGEAAITVTPLPGVLTVDDMPPKDGEALSSSYVPSDHVGLLCLEFPSRSRIFDSMHQGEPPKPSAAGLPLPSVVLPIGRLRNRYKGQTGIYSIDTDYVLVVDAVADAHPLWLIFDRKIRNHEEDEAYVKPETVKLVFSGTERNFDASQVIPSVQDWIRSYGSLDFTQIRDSCQQTGITGEVRARNITFRDLPASWNRVTG